MNDVNNAIDSREYSKNADTLFCRFMSPILFLSAVSILVSGLFVFNKPLPELLLDTLVMLFFTASFEALLRSSIKQTIRHHLVAVTYCLAFLFAVLKFYPSVGPALWTFAFIQIVMALSQNSQTMLVYSAVSVTIAAFYVSVFQTQTSYTLNIYYIIAQLVLLCYAFCGCENRLYHQ